jgi:hypothetical protein
LNGLVRRPVNINRRESDEAGASAHGGRPGLLVERDQHLRFSQMMGVAERIGEAGQASVGLEAVVNHNAAALGQTIHSLFMCLLFWRNEPIEDPIT